MGRPRVVDARDMARNMRETFVARDVEYEEVLPFSWPSSLQNIGDSLAVAYDSDKWKKKGWTGRRPSEDYKHIAESRHRLLARPLLLGDYYTRSVWPVVGPFVSFATTPMPAHFSILGDFVEASLRLHVAGTDDDPLFGTDADDGVVKITLAEAVLGASKIRWSHDNSRRRDQPFLFVYDRSGVQMIIVGDKLDVERDGIVG